jgi:C1A family cysteine protease
MWRGCPALKRKRDVLFGVIWCGNYISRTYELFSMNVYGHRMRLYALLHILFLLGIILICGTVFAQCMENASCHTTVVTLGLNAYGGTPLSGGLFLAPVNPAFAEYQNQSAFKSTEPVTMSVVMSNGSIGTVPAEGIIPSPVSLDHTTGQHIGPDGGIQVVGGTYPNAYDLRTSSKVSPVKNQGTADTCWVFASVASLESYFLPQVSWDFSENNIKNTLSVNYTNGFDRGANDMGNTVMTTAYFTRWSGPVTEAEDPYSDTSITSPTNLAPVVHVQNVYFLPPRSGPTDNDNIKYALTTYGAVTASIDFENSYYNATSVSFYNPSTSTYTNHAVTLVGWDDSYSKTNFATTPPGDGAFIAKNSWGTTWGNQGYFYISYYDATVGNDNKAFTGEPTTDYTNEYSYDPLGLVGTLGYYSATTASYANVFTATSAQSLTAVGFYTPATNTAYQVRIYLNPAGGPLNPSGYAVQTSGTLSSPGYHTVTVPAVALSSGQRFSVVVTASTPGYDYPIPIQYPLAGYSSHATASAGQGYVSPDGTNWNDITNIEANAAVCLKAYTTMPSSSSTSLVGIFRNGIFYLGSSNTNGGGTINGFTFGTTGDIPVVGDWTGSGTDTVGIFRNGVFYLASANQNNGGTINGFTFGTTGDIPVVGDWTGSGTDTVGIFRNGVFYLASANQNNGGTINGFTFGSKGDIPVVWSHNGIDTVGVFRNGMFYLASANQNNGGTVTAFTFGTTGDKPVTGIWS